MNKHSHPIGASPCVPTSAPAYSPVAGAEDSPNDGYGKQPRCETCKRGFYGCICNVEDGTEDHMPAADVVRIMGDYFPETGWARAERSALGMGK